MSRPPMLLADAGALQISLVERIEHDRAGFPRAHGFSGLDEQRQPRESHVAEQPAKRLEPQTPIADMLVPIDAAPAWPLRIVRMQHAQAVESDDPAKRRERL